MLRLDGLSAYLLLNDKPGAYQHTLKIGIFDQTEVPGGWDFEKFRVGMDRVMQLLPLFRCKIVRVPFGLHRPVWVEDPNFDIDYHLRYVTCPAPGDNRTLCRLISEIYAYPLDQSKPLWQVWVIDGLVDNQMAIVGLHHHSYNDGTAAARLMERSFSTEPTDKVPMPPIMSWGHERMPSKLTLILAALRDIPVSLFRSLPKVLRGHRELRRVKEQYAASGEDPAPNPFRDSRDSPFNVVLSHGRTFVLESFPFDRFRRTAKRFGVTINDLFLTIMSDAFRHFMQERGYDVDKGPLLATIPLGRRPPVEQDDLVGNKTTSAYLWLPVHIADPIERLRYAHTSSLAMKKLFEATEGADPASLMEIIPLPLHLLPDWIVTHRKEAIGQSGNAILSNVKGPEKPLYWGRMRLLNWFSIGMVSQGCGINTTVWSYAGNFNLCIMADKKAVPNGWDIIERVWESFETYETLAENVDKESISSIR